MGNLKRMTGFILMCILMLIMAGAAIASVADSESSGASDESNTSGTTAENGQIASFNGYGENGSYDALGEYEIAYGTELTDVTSKLPDTLTAKLTTGEEVEVPVTWVCVDDGVGGTSYLAEHEDATAEYTFEARLGDEYTLADNIADDFTMPYVTVRYTEDAQELNSTSADDSLMGDAENAVDDVAEDTGFSWTWIIWIVVIVIVIVILWWLFAGNKGNGKDSDN